MDVGPHVFLWAFLYDQQVVARLPVRPGSDELGHKSNGEFFKG